MNSSVDCGRVRTRPRSTAHDRRGAAPLNLPNKRTELVRGVLGAAMTGLLLDSSAVALSGIGAWVALTAMLIDRRLHETTRRTPHVIEVIVTSIVVPLLSVYHRIRGGITFRVAFW